MKEKEVVFTGKFIVDDEHIVRDLLVEAAQAKGYIVGDKISFNTDILVLGDTGHHGVTKKIEEASFFGVKIVDPGTFLKHL